jgi:thymidylate kinase
MVFVNTSLEVAHERNQKRTRTLPKDIVDQSWRAVQNNIGKFQNLFGGGNMIIVDNNNASDNVLSKIWKKIRGLLKKPITNIIAKKWISNQLVQKSKR